MCWQGRCADTGLANDAHGKIKIDEGNLALLDDRRRNSSIAAWYMRWRGRCADRGCLLEKEFICHTRDNRRRQSSIAAIVLTEGDSGAQTLVYISHCTIDDGDAALLHGTCVGEVDGLTECAFVK